MWAGQIKVKDLETLEQIFATRTEKGWTLPVWLVWLRAQQPKAKAKP